MWKKPFIAFMAGLALILSLLILGKRNDRLYKQYYNPYQFSDFQSSVKDISRHSAMYYYNTGHYRQCISMVRRDLDSVPDDYLKRFLYASSLQAQGLPDEAAVHYRKLISEEAGDQGRLHYESYWYLGLCYLQEGKTDSVRYCLRRYISSNNPAKEKEKARALLNRVRRQGGISVEW